MDFVLDYGIHIGVAFIAFLLIITIIYLDVLCRLFGDIKKALALPKPVVVKETKVPEKVAEQARQSIIESEKPKTKAVYQNNINIVK